MNRDFDRQVKESKQVAEDGLQTTDHIQTIITDAFAKTKQAADTLEDAKENADTALEKTNQADDLAKKASTNEDNIKKKAQLLFKNATNLSNEADLMAGRVLNTQSEFKMLLEQTRSNDSLIHQVKEKVGRAGKVTTEASTKVSDLLGDVESIISELQNLPDINSGELDRLEYEIKQAEERVRNAKLDEKLGDLQKQQKNQNDLIEAYKNEIGRLEREVENVELIAGASRWLFQAS